VRLEGLGKLKKKKKKKKLSLRVSNPRPYDLYHSASINYATEYHGVRLVGLRKATKTLQLRQPVSGPRSEPGSSHIRSGMAAPLQQCLPSAFRFVRDVSIEIVLRTLSVAVTFGWNVCKYPTASVV
jgi:hypothetical protein